MLMYTLFGYLLPLIGLALLIASRAFQFRSRLLPLVATLLNLGGLAMLLANPLPNAIWVALFAACAIALLLVVLLVDRDYDLVLKRYFSTLGGVLTLATTLWWLGAILITL